MPSITRRTLLAGLASSGITLSAASGVSEAKTATGRHASHRTANFLEIMRQPDSITVFLGLNQPTPLHRTGTRWEERDIRIRVEPERHGLPIYVAALGSRPTHIRCRWNVAVFSSLLLLGDHWERSYGDLHWSHLVPERVMPWYFLACDGESLLGYGVKTGSAALCFWQADPDGISLWLNVGNGGAGVDLGERELLAATLISRRGEPGESPMYAAKAFCRMICDAPRVASSVIYGSNDWYYAYGKNSAEGILRDAELVSSVAPAKGDRPFTIIDDGWQNKKAYPDMAALAEGIRQRNVRPGLWIRPLEAPADAVPGLLLPKERFGPRANRQRDLAYDPTIPEALELVLAKVKEAIAWGYELVKHDYTTFELLGQWGFEMKAQPTLPGWNFHDQSRTTAEIVRDLYANIRRAAGERTILIGCNTMGHLAAGLFEVQRTGDDTSGRNWERTRRMGVNTLAYRLPQHRAFFLLDADCVPITMATPWSCNRQWLDLVARSGTALLISPEPGAIGDEQRRALREAFQIALSAQDHAYPVDWTVNTTPGHWEFGDSHRPSSVHKKYNWYQDSGAWPYDV